MDPGTESARRTSAQQTRLALVRAGLRLFGEHGFAGTSTRAIAVEANANIGSIAYHFGGKEGLRAACADHIVETIGEVAGRALEPGPNEAPAPQEPEAARAMLAQVVETMVGFIVARPEAGEIVRFVLREMAHPTAALDVIYAGVFEPVHRRLCRTWEAATGEPAESERTRLTVFAVLGQVVYFRIGRAVVQRRMGWAEIGPDEAAAVTSVVQDNLSAILDARGGERP